MKMKNLLLTLLTASLTLSALGQIPSKYQKVRKMTDLAEKKRFMLGLERDDQVRVWREHFAHVSATEVLTIEQREYLARSLEAFEADELTDELDQEAKDLFNFELGRKVFNPGPFDSVACKTDLLIPKNMAFSFTGKRFADCDCRQTGTNWSCDGSCLPSSSCTPTQAGCSIFYLYPCDGKCNSGGTKEGDE